jgi:uncharacterized linocin/CFP29 family protein
MNGILGRDKLWNQQIWSDIDNAVRDEVGRIRVAQKVFPCTLLPSGQQVPADKVGPELLHIEEGETKPFVEIWVEFTLTQSQVESEESLHTGRTLARMAANKVATAEDALLFQGEVDAKTHLKSMSITFAKEGFQERNATRLKKGFLGVAAEVADPPYVARKELEKYLRETVDIVPDHSRFKKFRDNLQKIVNKTDVKKKFEDLKDELGDIVESVPGLALGDLKDKLNASPGKIDEILKNDNYFKKRLKDDLSKILESVPHDKVDQLTKDLKNLKDFVANDSNKEKEFKVLRPDLRSIVNKIPDHAKVKKLKDDLEGIVKRVSPYVEVKDSEADPKILVRSVLEGIAKLSESAQLGPYALFLPLRKFADASAPLPQTLVAPADRIIPLVKGGFYGTGCLPSDEGLLVSLGGEPTTIYIGIDATTAFTHIESNGIYRFRVFERFQFVARDSRAFLTLSFK